MSEADQGCDPIMLGGDEGIVVPDDFGSHMWVDERGIVHTESQSDLDRWGDE